jgi:predicted peroxiredoxin
MEAICFMNEVKNLLIVVNSSSERKNNQYAAYVLAFVAKQIAKVETVTIFYGPQAVGMVKKGELAKFKIDEPMKRLIAGQIEGLSPSDLPDNLEGLARFEKDQLGVHIASCGTFHVVDGFADSIDDKSKTEEFIRPLKLPQVMKGILATDKILYY